MNLVTEPQEPLSVAQRVSGVLLGGPRQVFADIARQPGWLIPLLMIIAVNLLCALATLPKLKEFMSYTMQQQLQTAPELGNAATLAMTVKAAGMAAVAGSLLAPVLMILLWAALLKLFNLFVGEPAPYRQFFAVVVYSYFPIVIGGIIATIMILISPATHLQEVSTSLYVLFPPGSKGFAAALARQVDPFLLWSLGLTAIGSSVISRSQTRSYTIVIFTLWVLFAVISAWLARGL